MRKSHTPRGAGGGGGGVLWNFHTYIGSAHFFGFKILNFNIFWGFQKNEYFLGVWRFCRYFFGGHHKNGLVWGSFLCNLGSFFKVKVQNWDIFWVAKISNIFLGCLKFLLFFGVNGRCWVRAYVYGKKLEYPPLGPHNDQETPGRQKKQSSQLSLPHWDVWTGPAGDGETQAGLHAWWSTQSRLATLLSSLIARGWVGLLWRFRLKDLSRLLMRW